MLVCVPKEHFDRRGSSSNGSFRPADAMENQRDRCLQACCAGTWRVGCVNVAQAAVCESAARSLKGSRMYLLAAKSTLLPISVVLPNVARRPAPKALELPPPCRPVLEILLPLAFRVLLRDFSHCGTALAFILGFCPCELALALPSPLVHIDLHGSVAQSAMDAAESTHGNSLLSTVLRAFGSCAG
jgi:hypothetical protein